jgi:uncharacterized membrane protein YsdA (DUF1294 family)
MTPGSYKRLTNWKRGREHREPANTRTERKREAGGAPTGRVSVPWWGWWFVAWSGLAFLACVIDKVRARSGSSRIPERVLLGLALVGGSPGLLVGMLVAHHKTRKLAFIVPLILIVSAQGIAMWFVR